MPQAAVLPFYPVAGLSLVHGSQQSFVSI